MLSRVHDHSTRLSQVLPTRSPTFLSFTVQPKFKPISLMQTLLVLLLRNPKALLMWSTTVWPPQLARLREMPPNHLRCHNGKQCSAIKLHPTRCYQDTRLLATPTEAQHTQAVLWR